MTMTLGLRVWAATDEVERTMAKRPRSRQKFVFTWSPFVEWRVEFQYGAQSRRWACARGLAGPTLRAKLRYGVGSLSAKAGMRKSTALAWRSNSACILATRSFADGSLIRFLIS